jgi:2-deoxy-D-gluconate 3-dehydrogenase
VTSHGRTFDAFQVNFADPAALDTFIDQTSGRQIDILVNNAGIIRRGPAAVHSGGDWAEVLQVNLTAQFTLAQAVGRQMLERGYGKIIFTASMLSFQGGVNVVSYTAAKSAVAGLVKALANEWASKGVNVNAVAPGYIATDNTQALRDDPERNRAIVERIPVGRWGEPGDVAGAYVFLSSAASDYVHGVVLPVDGGWMGR